MPIHINEFEISVEEPPAEQSRGGGGGGEEKQPQAPQKTKPEEIVAAVRACRDRLERVRAD